MDTIEEKIEELAAAIQESTEYESFQAAKRRVQDVPGLADRVREYCWKNYELQNGDTENLYERMEELETQYGELRRDSVVEQYLEQEVHMCRVLQAVNARIMDTVELVI